MAVNSVFGKYIVFIALLALAAGNGFAQSEAAGKLAADLPAEGRTVIMGTWDWDIESGKQKRTAKSDLWWEQLDEVRQLLVPINGAGLAVLDQWQFDSVDADSLARLTFSNCPIENTKLEPDDVVALRTAEGNFAKIRVVGYREMHDLSFPDIKQGDVRWFNYLLTRPNRPKYHLEVDWTLYPHKTAGLN
jgi:hypothetical protein